MRFGIVFWVVLRAALRLAASPACINAATISVRNSAFFFAFFIALAFANAVPSQAQQSGCRTSGQGNSIVCDTCASAASAPLADRQRILSGNENQNGTQGSNNAFCRITNLNPGDDLTLTVEDLNSMNIASFDVHYQRNGAMPSSLTPVMVDDTVGVTPMSVPSVQSFAHSEAGAANTRVNVNISGTQPNQVGQNSEVGATVTCSCTPATGALRIEKVALGGNDTFEIDATNNSSNAVLDYDITTAGGSGGETKMALATGTYTISETPPAGWVLDSIVCGRQTTDQAVVVKDQTTTCVVTNKKLASVTIKKVTIDDTGAFEFNATSSPMGQGAITPFTETTNAVNTPSSGTTLTNLVPGDYTFTETPPNSGWDLTALDCQNASGVSRNGFAGSFTLDPGAVATCTYTNTRQTGGLKVIKSAQGAAMNELFTFEIRDDQSALVGQSFDLGDGGMNTVNGLPTGDYTITETNLPAGWALDDINCGTRNGNTTTVTVTNNQVTECTFTNSKNVGQLKVSKKTINGNDNFDFDITDSQNQLSATATGLANGDSQTFDLVADTYTISEVNLPPGWSLTDVTCNQPTQLNNNSVDVTVQTGMLTECEFTNQLAASSLTIVKDVPGSGDTTSFNFTNAGPQTPANFALSDGQSQNFTTTGRYVITEAQTSGYQLSSLQCSGTGANGQGDSVSVANRRTIVQLDPGENIVCTYTNKRLTGSIKVRKVTIGGDGNFDFRVTGQSAFQLSNGQTRQFSNLSVGQYTIREVNLPSGWTLQNIACTGGGNRQGNGITVDLSSNQSITCTFTNFKKRDERMRDVTRLFIHRRVDNLLTHDPDRARILRRLQPRRADPPCSLKDDCNRPPPLKLGAQAPNPVGGQTANRLGGVGTASLPNYGQNPANPGGLNVFANQGTDDQPWDRRSGQSSPLLSSIMGQLSGVAGGSSSFKFGTSLSELRESAAAAQQQSQERKLKEAGLAFDGQYLPSFKSDLSKGWDVWVEGHISRYNDGTGGISREGDFRLLYVGADYALAPGILVGALVQFDDTSEDVEDPTLLGEVEGTGWMAGPYIGIRLTDSVYFDARAAWGRSDNDIWLQDTATGRRSGSFDTERWLATATLTGNHMFGAWRLSPQVGIAYGSESYDTYYNSLGQVVDGGRATIGRVTGGLEVGYQLQLRDGAILEPHIGIKGLWNFQTTELVVDGVPVDDDENRAQIEGGLMYRTVSGWALRGSATYDGIGTGDFESYSGQLWVNIPLN